MSARAETLPKGLVVGVLILTLVVLALGGAVVALRLRPEPLPENAIDRAVAQWEQAVDENPEDARAFTGLGLALLGAERDPEALQVFEEAVTLDDTAWLAKFQIGLLIADDDPQRALKLIFEASRQAPERESVAPLIAYGDLLLEVGEPKDARDAYRRALVFDPFLYDAHFGLGQAYEALGKDQAALESYREAGRFDPNSEAVADAIERLNG